MKIWHISDTHTFHDSLRVPDGIDMVVFSGDCSNPKDPWLNRPEVQNFIEWFSKLDIKFKIFVGGNHDTSIEKRLIKADTFTSSGIIYLENSSVEIEGIKIWGTPVTPNFGEGWAWNRNRDKMDKLWRTIPEDTDIIISHGPPKGILDLSRNRDNELELCGCSAFRKHIMKIQPKLCLFGHIHSSREIANAGTIKLANCQTIFSNGSCVEDGRRELSSNGSIISI